MNLKLSNLKGDKKNISALILGESLWGFQTALIFPATVLAVLLPQFGAGERMIGSIDAISAGGIVLPQIIGIYLFRSRKKRKLNLILWHIFVMAPLTFFMGLVILYSNEFSPVFVRWALLLLFLAFVSSIGIILAVWLDWLASIFEQRIRGTAMGLSWTGSAIAGTAGGLLAGFLIRKHPGIEIYAWLHIAASVFMVISIISFFLLDDFDAAKEENPPIDTKVLFSQFRKSLKEKNFRNFLFSRLIARAGFCILPFLAVYYTSSEGGGISNGTVVSCGSAQTMGMAMGCLVLGRLGDLRGHRLGLIIGVISHFIALIILIFSNGMVSCIAAYMAVGIGFSADITSHANMVFETCPHENRVAHITISNLVMAGGAVIFPLLAGFSASVWGLKPLFMVSAFVIIIALFWLIFKVKEPRTEKIISEVPI